MALTTLRDGNCWPHARYIWRSSRDAKVTNERRAGFGFTLEAARFVKLNATITSDGTNCRARIAFGINLETNS